MDDIMLLRSAKHAVEVADRMVEIIMKAVHGREPIGAEPLPLIASEEPRAQNVIAAVKQIFDEFAATDLQDCLSALEDEPVEESRVTRQSREKTDHEDYGYILREVNREPGLEVQLDDEAGIFADDTAARLQFVIDLECGSIYAKNMAQALMGRPQWAYDIDNETMFYCSKLLWNLYEADPDAFGGDDREARRVALLAAELFEEQNIHADWDKVDYGDEIWRYVGLLEERLCELEATNAIHSVDQLRELLYTPRYPTKESRQEAATELLKRLDAGDDLCGTDDLLSGVTGLLRAVANDG